MSNKMVYNKVMLASDVVLNRIRYPVVCMPKIDGVRAINLNGIIMPRSFKGFKNKAINETYSNPNFIGFDGEFVIGQPTSISCCRDTTSNVSAVEGEMPDWYLFDYVTEDTYNLPYFRRWRLLRDRIESFNGKYPFIKLVKCREVYNLEALLEYEEEVLSQGYEGLIIRDAFSPYKFGRSTVSEQSLLRLKRFKDAEAKIVELIEAKANNNEAFINQNGLTERSTVKENMIPKGTLGSFICELVKDIELNKNNTLKKGDRIVVSSGKLNKEEKKHIFDNPNEYIGRIVKFKYFATGSKDSLRFPTFQSFRAKEDM